MTMKTIIEKKINSMCPINTSLIKDKGEPWIDHDILVKIHDKNRAWKKSKKIQKRWRLGIRQKVKEWYWGGYT